MIEKYYSSSITPHPRHVFIVYNKLEYHIDSLLLGHKACMHAQNMMINNNDYFSCEA